MTLVERFFDETVADLRAASERAGTGERRRIDDRIALLTDYRLASFEEAQLDRLLAQLRAGRSPVRLFVTQPEAMAADLEQRWTAYRIPALAGCTVARRYATQR